MYPSSLDPIAIYVNYILNFENVLKYSAAVSFGAIANFYDIPFFPWGLATSRALEDQDRFWTVATLNAGSYAYDNIPFDLLLINILQIGCCSTRDNETFRMD